MKKTTLTLFALISIFMLLTSAYGYEVDGSMKVKLGYQYTDESDNLSVNRETFNTYDGFVFSLNDINIASSNGFTLFGDLSNMSQNNRDLRVTAAKHGLLSLTFFNNQYRRTYSSDGSHFTRRETSGMNGYVNLSKGIKLFGGWIYEEKHGNTLYQYHPATDYSEYAIDYARYGYNVGTSVRGTYGQAKFEYRNVKYENDYDFDRDRKSEVFNLNLSGALPEYKMYRFAGGYYHRSDKIDAYSTELRTGTFWGAFKVFLKNQWTLNYRLLMSQSEHSNDINTVDNDYHTFSIAKAWEKKYGFGASYERRISDNDADKITANGYLVDGWYNYDNHLFVKAHYSFINKSVDDGENLIGESDRSRHYVSIRYVDPTWGAIKGKLEKRIKKYDDIGSKIDYTSASSEFTYGMEYGRITFGYTYNNGEYTNTDRSEDFEFRDHILTATVTPKTILGLTADVTSYYYRSKRDVQIEKFSFGATLTWNFIKRHYLSVNYQAYTYDDLLFVEDTYTSNNVEINLIHDLSF